MKYRRKECVISRFEILICGAGGAGIQCGQVAAGGIHPIDLMLWAVDARVEEVFMASNKKAAPSFPSDDCYLLTMRFVNGVIGECFVTCGCSGPRWGAEWERMFECFGTQGTLSGGQRTAATRSQWIWRTRRRRI